MVPAGSPIGSQDGAHEARAVAALARRIEALRAELAQVERALAAVAPPTRPRLRWLRGGRWPGRD
jgi:hypothetical protein